MKGFILGVIITLSVLAGVAYAQSTATPVIMGFLTTSGCPSGVSSCFIPYSATNPVPVACQ